jgi:CubicO group peptidase (beta-lactamase class C family)
MYKIKTLKNNHFLRFLYLMLVFVFLSTICKSQSRLSQVDSWMESNAKEMGGRTILVISQNGRIIYNKSVNVMSERQKALNKYAARKMHMEPDLTDYTTDSRQLIASCSKWLSAALIMTFVDEGKLSINDTVGKYLPVMSIHGKGNITIGECLSHLTGIKAPPIKKSLRDYKNIKSMDEAIAGIANLPMEGQPGNTFHYSSVGLQIAAAVIDKISGQSFEDLFAERIAKPLGLKNTDFNHHPVALPAGGASSTPADYLTFLNMILNKGELNGKRILSDHSIDEMEKNRILPGIQIAYSPTEATGFGYGYGEWVFKGTNETDAESWVTSPGLFGSFPWVNNEKHYCAFLMTFYIKSEGRADRYKTLKNLVDLAITNN